MAKKSPYETGELSDSIFLILLATLEPVHGYRIMQGVEESTDGAVKIGPATMYTTLKKLKAAGWIVEIAEDESRILYAATDEGRAVFAAGFVFSFFPFVGYTRSLRKMRREQEEDPRR